MLTQAGCLSRRARLWSMVPAELEWVLIADPRHVMYFSNFLVHPLSFSAGERAWLLLEREGKATLLGDNFTLRSRVGEPFVDDEVMVRWYDHKHSVMNRDHALLQATQQISERLYGRPGAVEAEWLPIGAFELLGLDQEAHSVKKESRSQARRDPIDLGTVIRSLRRTKEADEIALLKECMRAGEAGQMRAREIVRPGISEFEVFREVQNAALAAAGRPGLIYGDFRACTPSKPKQGGLPTDYKLQSGDLFVLDYSVVLEGYRSDFTNALAVGEPNAHQRHLYDVVMAAMKNGETALRAGAKARDVFDATEKPIRDAGLADKFAHHAGHGIGLAHPEPPILVPDSDDFLMEGDVLTLEPGLYVEGIGGIRIEHNYLITATGYERLSNHAISLY
ncbi:MAG: Xaa-Pro peptidase family protein [Planctomycetaceae bacterium]|nr:Xaa-Pro peptidase family protein [Planctomycetaceae bacterium]